MKTKTSEPDGTTAAAPKTHTGFSQEEPDARTFTSNGTSSKTSSESEGVFKTSSSNSSSACHPRNIDSQGNPKTEVAPENTADNSEEDVDIVGPSCDIKTTRAVRPCMSKARECAGESAQASASQDAQLSRHQEPTCAQKGDPKAADPEQGTSAYSEERNFLFDLEDSTELEDDKYNRFYFESDHMALKGNKDYEMLLQSLVTLEAQRAQAIKDLDILCEMQKETLQDPIKFVEKLQNNEPVNLPGRQKVAKVPHIPWEEYTTSLGALERQNFLSHHQTRSAAQQLEKVLSGTQSLEPEDPAPGTAELPSSRSDAYGVFGGEFVTSKSGRTLDRDSVSSAFSGGQAEWKKGNGRAVDEPRPISFNQAWTSEEQARLERLLQMYPQEDVEAKRWEKISRALGNRTAKQVASRVQKYFIKLAKAGLPVPGRVPTLPKPGARSKRSSHYQTLGFRNSTFFPSYQPRVYMNDDDDSSSIALSDDTTYPSDDESIPSELKETDEYRELMDLNKIKRQKLQRQDQRPSSQVQHHGFMCDGCGMDPITGLRFHCLDCPQDSSVDFCADCIDRGVVTVGSHQSTHRVQPVGSAASFFVDGDYVDYNYLDTNFLPAAS